MKPEESSLRDTRGLARALTGDIPGAIEDFQTVLDCEGLEEEIKQSRQHWLDALRAGENPFTPEELAQLRGS